VHVAELKVRNFRRLRAAEVSFPGRLNLLIGANAQGKTTLLEALAYLATTASPRTSRYADLITWGEPTATMGAVVRYARGGEVELRATLSREQGRLFALGQGSCAAGDLVGHLAVVFFSVEDLQLIKGGPAHRRRFLNLELGQVLPRYLQDLARYRRALRQRNAILARRSDSAAPAAELSPWTDALVRYGAPVIHDRAEFVAELAPHAARLHAVLGGEQEQLEVRYHCSVPSDVLGDLERVAAALRERYEATLTQDRARRTTHIGPHRDELLLHVNGKLARQFASQGQQRTAALALRLAEIPLVTRRLGEPPVLLLDDVMSELDPHRAGQVLGLVTEVEQVVLTGTHLPIVAGWPAEEVCALEVCDGAVSALSLGPADPARNALQEGGVSDAPA